MDRRFKRNRELALQKREMKAHVTVNYARDWAGAERVEREITGKGGRIIAVQGDVSSEVRRATPSSRRRQKPSSAWMCS